jgi:hypothetical protein
LLIDIGLHPYSFANQGLLPCWSKNGHFSMSFEINNLGDILGAAQSGDGEGELFAPHPRFCA